ncbi:MAG TPA: DUF2934 domain-containing protein [Opitutaceae bacterium]|nr:DUF2934 domain-containing protein [Opitutaceae bacterium]
MPDSSSNSNAGQGAGAAPSQDQITERARQLWMQRGSPAGRDLEHWLDAERQLRAEWERRRGSAAAGRRAPDPVEVEKRRDGLVEPPPSPARRTPDGERL